MSGSGGSGRRGDARRRRRSVEPETERFRGDDPLQRDDAWRDWLNNHARQRDERLPGPFVTSVSREPIQVKQWSEVCIPQVWVILMEVHDSRQVQV